MAKDKPSGLSLASWILGIIGGLNWGLVGFFQYNLVDALAGEGSTLARLIYDIVGLAALHSLWCLLQQGKK